MKNQKLFLEILKNFIHPNEKISKTAGLEAEDWEELLQMASDHAVLPIVYEVAWKAESFQKVPEDVRSAYKTRVAEQVIGQAQTSMVFLDLYRRMTEAGICPLVMKGIVCRDMYQLSDYRTSGDEDILVQMDQFQVLDAFLLRYGFVRGEVEDFRKEHEITYRHPGNGMRLEVHLSLFPEESGSYGRLNEEFPQVFERQIVKEIDGTKVYTLDATQHMVYLLCHGLKHFLHSGFGIRQLCDMVLFAETYGDVIDWSEVKMRTKRQNMYIFWMNLFDIGERYLGFSWEKAGLSKPGRRILHSEEMLGDLLDSGIYGKRSTERVHSANITLQASDTTGQKGSVITASLFPGIDYMKREYRYLERWKCLLPVAWIQRILEYRKKMRGKDITKPIETGKQRVKLLKSYGIIEK